MMDAVCVIPVNTEVRCCRFQSCETFYCFFGVCVALWVRVFRYTPDTFDCCIFADKFLYHIHVRTLWCHWYVDHFDSEEFCDFEMTVVSWYRTEEFYFVKFTPWCISHYAVSHGTCDAVEHYVKAGVSVDDDVVRIYFGHFAKETFCFRNTVDHTVVTAVYTCFTFEV